MAVNINERVPLPEPAWHQTEKASKIAGIALIALGSLGIIASVGAIVAGALSMPFGGTAAIIIGSIGLSGSISALAAGIFLVRKESWKDPVFVERIANQAKSMTFDQIVDQFGWEKTSQFHFVSKKQMTEKLLEKASSNNLSYSQLMTSYHPLLKTYQIIDWRALKPLLMAEIQQYNLSVKDFKNRFEMQPIRDHVIDANDPWLTGTLKQEIKGKSYSNLVAYEPLIDKNLIKDELMQQYASKTLVAFVGYHGREAFHTMIHEGILPAEFFKEKAVAETAHMTVAEILQNFSWNLLTHNILQGSDLAERFRTETLDAPLSQIINIYGWPVLYWGLTTKEVLHDKAIQEIKGWSFDQIIDKFNWIIFDKGVLSGSDPLIKTLFQEKIKSTPFAQFWANYSSNVKKYNLLDATLIQSAGQLWNNLKGAETTYNQQVAINDQTYRQAVNLAAQQANLTKSAAERDVDLALLAYNRRYGVRFTFDRHQRRIHRDTSLARFVTNCVLQIQYEAALSRYHAAWQQAESTYAHAVTAAQAHKDALNRQATATFEATKGQIEQTFAQKISS